MKSWLKNWEARTMNIIISESGIKIEWTNIFVFKLMFFIGAGFMCGVCTMLSLASAVGWIVRVIGGGA